ncbi:hypothetical protein ACFYWP_37175 [Actinacidiphila glaucinigra]|uniref:hypothetical protein n=1 Tax=Actinacidiphila glaucinigra TaxID=235986 RepID=UPI0036B2FF2F
MAAMWEIGFPISRDNGARGVQTFLVRTDFRSDARAQALHEATTEDAIRHRGGADVDFLGMTIRLSPVS